MTKLPQNEGGKAVRYILFLLVVAIMIVSMMVASLPASAQEKTDCAQYAKDIQLKMSEDKSKDVAKLLAEEPTSCLQTTAEKSGGFCNTLLNYSASHPDLFLTRALANSISTAVEKCLQ